MTVRDTDRGMGRFLGTLEDLARPRSITVGVHEDVGAEDHPGRSRATKLQVAAAHEFGTAVDQPIAYVRGAADDFDGELKLAAAAERALRSAMYGSSDGGHADRAFARVGEQLARAMRRRAPLETGATRDAIRVKIDGTTVQDVG